MGFLARIRWMNTTFKLPCNTRVKDQGAERIYKFHKVITDEVNELLDAIDDETGKVKLLVVFDTLIDILVYTLSELLRWGFPTLQGFNVVMDSQESKLDPEGKPIMAPDGSKFIKGPNYVDPEPELQKLIEEYS